MSFRPLILGSASPRRQELLRAAGIPFSVEVSAVEERHDHGLAPEELTVMNAIAKATDIARRRPEALVLGADTLVYLDGEPLGKPASLEEAAAMLRRLSARIHTVCTGLCLAHDGRTLQTRAVFSQVGFGSLSGETIRRYHSLVDPLDKAGAYGFQNHADLLQAKVSGPVDNVIGLPVDAMLEMLAAAGWAPPVGMESQ